MWKLIVFKIRLFCFWKFIPCLGGGIKYVLGPPFWHSTFWKSTQATEHFLKKLVPAGEKFWGLFLKIWMAFQKSFLPVFSTYTMKNSLPLRKYFSNPHPPLSPHLSTWFVHAPRSYDEKGGKKFLKIDVVFYEFHLYENNNYQKRNLGSF